MKPGEPRDPRYEHGCLPVQDALEQQGCQMVREGMQFNPHYKGSCDVLTDLARVKDPVVRSNALNVLKESGSIACRDFLRRYQERVKK